MAAGAGRRPPDAEREDPMGETGPWWKRDWRRRLLVLPLVAGAVAGAAWLARDTASPAAGQGIVPLPAALNPDQREVAAAEGALAPDFVLTGADGATYRLSDWRGRPVVVNLWASWCAPCLRETPELVALYERHRAEGLVVAGVNIRETREVAIGYGEAFAVPYPLLLDRSGAVTDVYLTIGPPNSIFIDAEGVIRRHVLGEMDAEELEAAVQLILPSAGASTPE